MLASIFTIMDRHSRSINTQFLNPSASQNHFFSIFYASVKFFSAIRIFVGSGALYCEPIFKVIKSTMTTLNNLAIDIFCSISDKEEMFCNIVSSAPTQTSSCSVISATLLFTKSATASPIFRVRISLMFRKIYFQGLGIYKFLVLGNFTNQITAFSQLYIYS